MQNTVYHYTSPDGILNILKYKTLRFTDCQYLNDMSEFVYIREPFEKAWERVNKERDDSDDSFKIVIENFFKSPYELLIFYNNNTSKKLDFGFTHHRYYVLCASKKDDIANMWNYYVKNGIYQGYNLGIDRKYISQWFSNYSNNQVEFIEGEVIYDKELQIELIYNELKKLLGEYDRIEKTLNDFMLRENLIGDFQDKLYHYIHRQKLFFKNPAFASEEEYRFVLKVDNDFSPNKENPLSLDFRVGTSGIITPFIEWKFKLGDKERLFKQITLAPMIEPSLAEESFTRFLTATIRQNIVIKQSSIKLRF